MFLLNPLAIWMSAQRAAIVMIGTVLVTGVWLFEGRPWTHCALCFVCGSLLVRWCNRGIAPTYSQRRIDHISNPNAHVLITGANTGVGFATAEQLVELGVFRVILACRNVQKGTEAAAALNSKAGRDVAVVVPCDLASLASVRSAAAQVRAMLGSTGTLDLVLNAGLSCPQQNGGTAEKLELHFGTMHVGHFVLTHELAQVLYDTKARRGNTEEDRSRIVVLASMNAAYIVGEPEFEKGLTVPKGQFGMVEYYSRAKLANVLFARGLNARAGEFVLATSCCPGGVASDVWRDQPLASILFNTIFIIYLRPNREGAFTPLHCLLSDKGVVAGEFHADTAVYAPAKPRLIAGAKSLLRSDVEADKLWKLSEKFVKSNTCSLL
jgi:NAD(P)-dependent dehydrogenase (short-subunit alcohol dehydrogenase family)